MLFKFNFYELLFNFNKLTEIISNLLLTGRIFGERSDCIGCKAYVGWSYTWGWKCFPSERLDQQKWSARTRTEANTASLKCVGSASACAAAQTTHWGPLSWTEVKPLHSCSVPLIRKQMPTDVMLYRIIWLIFTTFTSQWITSSLMRLLVKELCAHPEWDSPQRRLCCAGV